MPSSKNRPEPPSPQGKPSPMDPEILERIHRGILMRTGAYLTNDHFVLPSGRHVGEFVEKSLATTEPAFTEGLGEVLAEQFANQLVDIVLTTGYGASILGHCVARAHPSRPRFLYALKRKNAKGRNEVTLPREFRQFFSGGARVLLIEDILTTGETVRRLIDIVRSLGGTIVGIGSLWRRTGKLQLSYPVVTLVIRDLPSYLPEECPMCKRGMPVNSDIIVGRG